jgi:hypothetical protein
MDIFELTPRFNIFSGGDTIKGDISKLNISDLPRNKLTESLHLVAKVKELQLQSELLPKANDLYNKIYARLLDSLSMAQDEYLKIFNLNYQKLDKNYKESQKLGLTAGVNLFNTTYNKYLEYVQDIISKKKVKEKVDIKSLVE